MIDTYLSSPDEAALKAFCAFFRNHIKPRRGTAATEDRPAIGDPNIFYACVRSPAGIVAGEGIDVVDAEIGAAIVGTWL